MRVIIFLFMLILMSGLQPAYGQQSEKALAKTDSAFTEQGAFVSPVLEARAVKLFGEIKCPVCVAQSVAESDAEISKTLRDYIRQEIIKGQADHQILDGLSSRYGDAILLKPPFQLSTLPLWIAPWLFLFLGFFIWKRAHHVRQQSAP